MRKTSQDGGESTSATSRVESESRKSKGSLLDFKTKKIGKRTAPNLSEESDEAVVEPLLETKSDKNIQNAKYYAKAKADTVKEISKLFSDKKTPRASTSGFGTTETLLSEKDQGTPKHQLSSNASLHNYMNTNVFHRHDLTQSNGNTKSQIMVEVGGSKENGYNPSPLIFTTAKIHSDEKSKHMEPVQMTPGPIVSTVVEKSQYKYGKLISTNIEQRVDDAATVHNDDLCHIVETEMKLGPILGNLKECCPTDFPTAENTSKAINSNVNDRKQKIEENIHTKHLTDETAKTDIITTLTNTSTGFNTSSLNSTITVNAKANSANINKMLEDEPRVLLSDSMIKPNYLVTSVKPIIEPTVVLESIVKKPQPNQLFGDENPSNKTTNARIIVETKSIQNNINKEESKKSSNKSMKSPTLTKNYENKSNTSTTMTTQQQKYTPSGISNKTNVMISKNADSSKPSSANISTSSSKNSETLKVSNSKTPMSIKVTTQASNLSKEIDKTQKPSANGSVKMNSKINNAAISSTSTIPSMGEPASSIISPSTESAISESSNITVCTSSASTAKAITSTLATTTLTLSNATKTTSQSTSTKATISTPNPKPSSSSSTKSTSKSSSASSKSTQIASTPTTGSTKQTNTHTAKITSSKLPSLASTKMPSFDISSRNPITTTGKSVVSKTIPASTSKLESTSSVGSRTSTAHVQATSNAKTKTPDSNKNISKPTDRSKDPR